MRIPDADAAYVPEAKLHGYLLAASHPAGGPKARLFRAHGYDESSADALAAGLCRIVQISDAVAVVTAYGTKFVADGVLRTPRGGTLRVRTIWIVTTEEARPRLVTAYPF